MAIELLDYWNRAQHAKAPVLDDDIGEAKPRKLSEKDMVGQFNSLRSFASGPYKIPERERELIRWAEAQKEKMGTS